MRNRVMMVLGLIGFAVAMTVRDGLTSIDMRVLLVVVAGGFLGIAYLHAWRRGREIDSTLRHMVVMVLGVIGFAVAMTVRDELSSIYTRAMLGGVAGGFIAIGVVHASRRRDRQ